MKKVALYARVSTYDQHTLEMQIETMSQYVRARNWEVVLQVKEIGSGNSQRENRAQMMLAARRRAVDVIIVWKLDRWGRSVSDLIETLNELNQLGVGFISITEALDLTTPSGRAMAGMLAVFAQFESEILKERIKAGMDHARKMGKKIGRPTTVGKQKERVKTLFEKGLNKSQIARKLNIPRTTIIRLLKEN